MLLSIFGFNIRRVDNRQSARCQAFPRYVMEKFESIRRCSLVILIVRIEDPPLCDHDANPIT